MTDEFSELRLQGVLLAYLQALDRGEKPDRRQILDAHPDLHDELAEYFDDASKLERLAKSLKTRTFIEEASVASPLLGKVRYLGDYELLDEIAQGGMGVVYKAMQIPLHRIVAVKMILKGQYAHAIDIRRFRQEAEAAANLDHPNIVPIYEVGEHEGQPYFSMKLIEQPKEPRAYTPYSAAALVAKIARAVHYAHQRGILHRDLKPSNILIDGNGEPHVADFGLAKKVEGGEATTQSEVPVGTPLYMAPEQARAEKSLTTAADVYSLGAILYEWLTGRPPLCGEDRLSTLMKVISEAPPKPRSLNPLLDRDLETVCLKCLEKEPGKRYGSALALAEDLERWQRGEPILARPVGSGERLWRWCQRNPIVAGLAAALVLSLTAGIVVSVSYALLAEERADRADSAQRLAIKEQQRADAETVKVKAENLAVRRQVYINAMNLLVRAWEGNQIAQVRKLLESQLPEQTGGVDLRGFEWHYWNRAAHAEKQVWKIERRSPSRHGRISFTPDGKQMLIPRLELRDVATGQTFLRVPSRQVPKDEESKKTGVFQADLGKRWSTLTSDGQWLVVDELPSGRAIGPGIPPSASAIQFLDRKTGQLHNRLRLKRTDSGRQTTSVGKFSLSADGRRVAALLATDYLGVWDVATLQPLPLPPLDPKQRVWDIELAPDGQTIALVRGSEPSDKLKVEIWQVQPWQHKSTMQADTRRGYEFPNGNGHDSLEFSPDGSVLAFVEDPWSKQPGKEVIPTLPSPRQDRSVVLCDTATGRPRCRLQGHEHPFNPCLAFSSDGKRIATGDGAGVLRIWDMDPKNPRLLRTLKGHTSPIDRIAFHPNGTEIISEGGGSLRFWDLHQDQTERRIRAGGVLAVSANGQHYARAVQGRKDLFEIVSLDTGKVLQKISHPTTAYSLLSLDAQARRAVTVDYYTNPHNCVQLWDLTTPEQPITLYPGREISKKPPNPSDAWEERFPQFSPDGSYLVITDAPLKADPFHQLCNLQVWHVPTQRLRLTVANVPLPFGLYSQKFFTADGKLWLRWQYSTVEVSKVISQLWDLSSGKMEEAIQDRLDGVVMAFHSPSGQVVVSKENAENQSTLIVADWRTGAERFRLTPPYADPSMHRVCFSPDGKRLAGVWLRDNRYELIICDTVTGAEVGRVTGEFPPYPGEGGIRAFLFAEPHQRLILHAGNGLLLWEGSVMAPGIP